MNQATMSSSGLQMRIREGRPSDARRLGELMTQELKSRIANLGQGVVTLLHEQIVASQYGMCVVAEQDGQVVGYAAIITSGRRFYREFLLRKGLRCALIALPRILKPSNLLTAMVGMKYFPRMPHDDPEAEMISFVVDFRKQGTGVGRELWNGVVRGLRERKIRELKICTDTHNRAANEMYLRRGCRLVRREPLYHDSDVNVYIYRDEPPTAPRQDPQEPQ